MAYVSLVPFMQVEPGVQDIMRTYDKEYMGSDFIRAFPQANGGALVHLHNVSGGVLAGDRLLLQIAVGACTEWLAARDLAPSAVEA